MPKAVGDYKVCIDSAMAFYNVASKTRLEEIGVADFLKGMMFPFVVNGAFSCELFIKAIMIHHSINNEFYKGHNLKDLFNCLPQNDRTAIERLYNKNSRKNLYEFLSESGDAFVSWRYALEQPVEACVGALWVFLNALKDYTLSMQ